MNKYKIKIEIKQTVWVEKHIEINAPDIESAEQLITESIWNGDEVYEELIDVVKIDHIEYDGMIIEKK